MPLLLLLLLVLLLLLLFLECLELLVEALLVAKAAAMAAAVEKDSLVLAQITWFITKSYLMLHLGTYKPKEFL